MRWASPNCAFILFVVRALSDSIIFILLSILSQSTHQCFGSESQTQFPKEKNVKPSEISFEYLTSISNTPLSQAPGVCYLIQSKDAWVKLNLPEILLQNHPNSDSIFKKINFETQSILALTWSSGNQDALGLVKISINSKGSDVQIEIHRPSPDVPQMGYSGSVMHFYKVDIQKLPEPIHFIANGKPEKMTLFQNP